MAGGSADAAAALLACAALWDLELTKPGLVELAARLGSDVAFPLTGGTALGTGRGEVLTPVLATGEFHWVLAPAGFGIADRRRLRASWTGCAPPALAPTPAGSPDEQLDALRAGDCGRLGASLTTTCRRRRCRCTPSWPTSWPPGPRSERSRRWSRGPGRPARSCAPTTPTPARWRAGVDAAGVPHRASSRPARRTAPASRSDGQPRQSRERREVVRDDARPVRRSRSASGPGSGSASSGATATANRPCAADHRARDAGRRTGHRHRRHRDRARGAARRR